MTNNTRAAGAALGLAAMLCATAVAAAPAQAKGGGSGVRASGSCTGAGHWTLKAKADDGRLAVEFEIDTNHAGQVWHVRITDNAHLVTSRTARTVAPSGSFTVHTRSTNRTGVDVIHAHGTRGTHSCSATVRY
jgi:hypothetical protein